MIIELIGKSIEDIVTTSSGTAIKYANGLVEEFGQVICPNVNGYVAQCEVTLPVPLDKQKSYAAFCGKSAMANSVNATRVTTFANFNNDRSSVTFGLQIQSGDMQNFSEANRTISWSVKGFWK